MQFWICWKRMLRRYKKTGPVTILCASYSKYPFYVCLSRHPAYESGFSQMLLHFLFSRLQEHLWFGCRSFLHQWYSLHINRWQASLSFLLCPLHLSSAFLTHVQTLKDNSSIQENRFHSLTVLSLKHRFNAFLKIKSISLYASIKVCLSSAISAKSSMYLENKAP